MARCCKASQNPSPIFPAAGGNVATGAVPVIAGVRSAVPSPPPHATVQSRLPNTPAVITNFILKLRITPRGTMPGPVGVCDRRPAGPKKLELGHQPDLLRYKSSCLGGRGAGHRMRPAEGLSLSGATEPRTRACMRACSHQLQALRPTPSGDPEVPRPLRRRPIWRPSKWPPAQARKHVEVRPHCAEDGVLGDFSGKFLGRRPSWP